MAPTPAVVARAIQDHFALRGYAWSELMLVSRLSSAGLSMEEWEEFLRICAESGTPKSAELHAFRYTIRFIDRYGDDGYGDRPEDMSRIIYWFQHVTPIHSRSRSRSR